MVENGDASRVYRVGPIHCWQEGRMIDANSQVSSRGSIIMFAGRGGVGKTACAAAALHFRVVILP